MAVYGPPYVVSYTFEKQNKHGRKVKKYQNINQINSNYIDNVVRNNRNYDCTYKQSATYQIFSICE
jgi:hypothetical protein